MSKLQNLINDNSTMPTNITHIHCEHPGVDFIHFKSGWIVGVDTESVHLYPNEESIMTGESIEALCIPDSRETPKPHPSHVKHTPVYPAHEASAILNLTEDIRASLRVLRLDLETDGCMATAYETFEHNITNILVKQKEAK